MQQRSDRGRHVGLKQGPVSRSIEAPSQLGRLRGKRHHAVAPSDNFPVDAVARSTPSDRDDAIIPVQRTPQDPGFTLAEAVLPFLSEDLTDRTTGILHDLVVEIDEWSV